MRRIVANNHSLVLNPSVLSRSESRPTPKERRYCAEGLIRLVKTILAVEESQAPFDVVVLYANSSTLSSSLAMGDFDAQPYIYFSLAISHAPSPGRKRNDQIP